MSQINIVQFQRIHILNLYTVTQPTIFRETYTCLMLCGIPGFHDRHQPSWNFLEQPSTPFLTTKGMKIFWKSCKYN